MKKKLIVLGAGGHAKVIADIAIDCEYQIYGYMDDTKPSGSDFNGSKILGKICECEKYAKDCQFIIAIGTNELRKKINDTYSLTWATLVHTTAVIGSNVLIGDGTVIMPNAVINSSSNIGKHCIINTAAVVEHDNVINDYVHISPGVKLAGTVYIGKFTHIGIGATVINNINICENVVVGAGACVVKDICEKGIYIGCPARRK